MSQISPPIRVLLLCAVAFMAAWMLFLKPKSEVAEPPAPAPNVQTDAPAVTGPGKAVEAAQEAAGTAPASGSATATEPASAPAQGGGKPAAEPAKGLKGVPKPVAKAIRDDKVVALLFWNPKSAEDRAVRSALRDANRFNGRVEVHAAPLRKISDYGRITRGVDVAQSPTIVIVDPEMRADTLVGYVDTRTIDQAVLDALRNSVGTFSSAYLREINSVCARYASSLWAMRPPDSKSAVTAYVTSARNKTARFARQFKAVPAPKKHRALKRASVRDNAAFAALFAEWATYLGPKPGAARILGSVERFVPRGNRIAKRYNRRMDAKNVFACGSYS